MNHRPRVLVGSPIRQKITILHEFLESLHRLEERDQTLDFLFIDDNEQEDSKKLLQIFAQAKGSKCTVLPPLCAKDSAQYICNENTHHWKESMIWKVAGYKDQIMQHARDGDYDYLFFVDSDLVLHPRTIDQLIRANRDIISNIFWTKWHPEQISLPQVWVSDHYTLFEHGINEQLTHQEIAKRQYAFLERLKKPGIYEVGGLGACTLISRTALKQEISFKRIKNLTFWGEDRHFCIRAVAIGLSLFVDTHLPAYHIYRDSDLPGVEEFKKKS
jgi:hypothetical protein